MAQFNVLGGPREPGRTRHQRLLQAADKGKALTDAELVKVWRAAQGMQDRAARGSLTSQLIVRYEGHFAEE